MISTLRRAMGIGLPWALVWLVFWAVIGANIEIFDPDSIDPGEGARAAVILGSMGLLSGIAFGMLLSIASRGRTSLGLPLTRVVGLGIFGAAVVQLPFLNHGDLGLAANLQMAMLFCAFAGVVTLAWLVMSRRWSHWRSSPRSS